MDTVQDIQFLTLPGKSSRLSFDDTGDNEKTLNKPLLVCIPGIGDSRTQFRYITPVFYREGYRVVRIDLRGMGASSTDFDDYKPESCGEDIHLIVQQLHNYSHKRGYIIVGNSFGAAAAVWNAAEHPDEVRGLVLVGPVIRDIPLNFFMKNLLRVLFGPIWWGASAWGYY
jgi:pimeloyl-ACP methyl ester carboxylesterase